MFWVKRAADRDSAAADRSSVVTFLIDWLEKQPEFQSIRGSVIAWSRACNTLSRRL